MDTGTVWLGAFWLVRGHGAEPTERHVVPPSTYLLIPVDVTKS